MAKKKSEWMQHIVQPVREGLRNYYFDIGTRVYSWENMPEEIPIRIPEKYLYESGLCVFFQPDGMDYMCLPVATQSIVKNVYGEPSAWSPVAVGEYAGRINSLKLDNTNSVLIRNDNAYKPTMPYVYAMIEQMVNVEMTTRMNINAQKMPYWFKTNDNNVIQNKNTFLELMEGQPVFFKTNFSPDDFEVIQSGAPIITDELSKMYVEYDSRILTYLGINSLPVEKSERLLVDEVGINREEKNLIRDSRLKQRELATERINKLFGLNTSVKVVELIDDVQGTQRDNDGSGKPGKEDGQARE